MDRDAWERLNHSILFLDETRTPLEIDRGEIEQFYEPLASAIQIMAFSNQRKIIAVAGPPGSGKTAFATLLMAVINAIVNVNCAVMIGLDGWHYFNTYLDNHFIWQNGKKISLRKIKGSPETYDLNAAHACLQEIIRGNRVSVPVYSRQFHDPIPNSRTIEPFQKIVILEGNYWLLNKPSWNMFQSMFDLKIFLKAASETLVQGLRERHLRGGKQPEIVEQQILGIDLPNIELVLRHSLPADVVLNKADSRKITHLEWKCSSAFT
jgi:putative kinase